MKNLKTVGDLIKELQNHDEKLALTIFDGNRSCIWIKDILRNSRQNGMIMDGVHINTTKSCEYGKPF